MQPDNDSTDISRSSDEGAPSPPEPAGPDPSPETQPIIVLPRGRLSERNADGRRTCALASDGPETLVAALATEQATEPPAQEPAAPGRAPRPSRSRPPRSRPRSLRPLRPRSRPPVEAVAETDDAALPAPEPLPGEPEAESAPTGPAAATPADAASEAPPLRTKPLPPPPRRPPGGTPPPGPPRPLAAGQVVPVLADGFSSGQIVSGKVVSVDQNEAVIDLGDRQGVISRRHLTVEGRTDPTEIVAVGDEVEAAVLVREDPKNRVVLSRTWAAKQRAWQAVEASMASGEPLRGTVLKVVKGGVLVDIGVRAFLPVSQIELHHVDNLASYVGQELDCLVAEADRTTDKIVLTRRALLRRLDRQRTGELLAGLSEGQTLKGVVTRLADYGAFVRVLDRIEGLVHVSELAEYRVHLPEEVVIPGDEVMVKVLRIDRRRRRVDLSVNQAVPVRRQRTDCGAGETAGEADVMAVHTSTEGAGPRRHHRPARGPQRRRRAHRRRAGRGLPGLRRATAGWRSPCSPGPAAPSAPAPTSRRSRPAPATGSTCHRPTGPLGVTRMLRRKPVIAAVEGYAVAGGLELALWCDLRVAARDATFGVYCRRWGVPLLDGGTIRLPRLIGQSHALDLILTGRGRERRRGGAHGPGQPAGRARRRALSEAVAPGRAAGRVPPALPALRPPLVLRAVGPGPRRRRCSTSTGSAWPTIASGETLEGAPRFAAGAGRHGSFEE